MSVKELPLAVIDGISVQPCVRSGFCCKQSPCGFGKWNAAKTQCEYLVGDNPGEYSCGIAEQIVNSGDSTWTLSPAFGAGCCSTLNTDRLRILRERLPGGHMGITPISLIPPTPVMSDKRHRHLLLSSFS